MTKPEDDEVIQVSLPRKDYKVMRELIDERKAMNGLRAWVTSRVFWLAGGVLTILGVFEAFRRFGD